MAEKIEDIAKNIKRHRDFEIAIGTTNNAVGRSHVIYDNVEQQFWISNSENLGGGIPIRDITNAIVGMQSGAGSTYTADGKPIYKNLKLGEILILNHEGTHKVKTPSGFVSLEIFNRASYNPSDKDNVYATDISVRLAEDSKTYSFRDIAEILKIQREIDSVSEQLKEATEEEAKLLLNRLEANELKKRSYLEKAQSFIRKSAQLRYQPILDPDQEKIKRSKIFDGTLIINGGPGTGKTTSLIQRIKFLISPSIEEYIKLNKGQKEVLFNQNTSWIFYSPNELLALFLRNSMKLEELYADSEKVKVWSSHKNDLIKTYRFVSELKRPFLIYNKSYGHALFVNNASSISNIRKGLESSYLMFQKEKLDKVCDLDLSLFKWKVTGQSIQKYIKDKKTIKNIEDLVSLFLNLNENFKKESDQIAAEYKTLIDKIASRIQVVILADSEREEKLSELLKQWKTDDIDTGDTDEDEDEDTEIEQEDFDEKEDQAAFDFEKGLFIKLKSLCRKKALKNFDTKTRFTKRDQKLLALIPEVNEQEEYDELGQTAFFKKFFERLTKGITANILREVPMIYKKHRRQQYQSKTADWNQAILEELVKKDRNMRIHPDEQALLLIFVNSIVYRLSKKFPTQYAILNHPYINGFRNHSKPVIGIDEATDFSVIDLVAINSFRHPLISAVTLSGDLMQRMTEEGLSSWDDFVKVTPNCEMKNLKVSYRQSPTLLALAKAIYKKSTGRIANYESYISKDEAEPKPLMRISVVEEEKLQWIADRIIEIYKAYGDSIPSIAIFLPDEHQLEDFATKLGGLDTLADIGITVKACRDGQVLGDKTEARVFSVKVIKGLEFECVFFHNLDELLEQELSHDLLLKYLYVGLSRATFYLGLTLKKELPKEISFLAGNFDTSGKTWAL